MLSAEYAVMVTGTPLAVKNAIAQFGQRDQLNAGVMCYTTVCSQQERAGSASPLRYGLERVDWK